MAVIQIGWGDGTTSKIYLEYTGTVGSSQMVVTSDPNTTTVRRTKTITFKSTMGATLSTLRISQEVGAPVRAFSDGFSPGFS